MRVRLKPELEGVHPRVFVTAAELETLRQRAQSTHRGAWMRVLENLVATRREPPPPPGPQERRSQNNVAFAIAEISLAYQIERKPEYLAAARRWILAAIDYEPWGYTYDKPNIDLAAGHLLYAIGWAYDLLYHDFSTPERVRIRASLERHATLVADHFSPGPGKRFAFTQNHNFIPTSGLAVTALALMGESEAAPRWAALARAHHHRAGMLLSPDGYYYEGVEYWIFSTPWLVHFLDAWEHSTGESLWDRDLFRNWKLYLAHSLLPDGQNVFDFGDIWEGPLTRAGRGAEYPRVYPGRTLQSNYNVLYGVAARLRDPETQAVADRYASFSHSNLEEYWTLLWRDPALKPAPIDRIPLLHHFEDSGVVFYRTSWGADATALAFKAGPPEGHRVAALLPQIPEWRLSGGHAHPDANSFIIWANGRYLTGDTGYVGLPQARHHNTVTVGGIGQGKEGKHDVWSGMPSDRLATIRISSVTHQAGRLRIAADAAGAYPAESGLRRFTRSFTFAAPATFVVEDDIEVERPTLIESYLHADTPISSSGNDFVIQQGGVQLRGQIASQTPLRTRAGETNLTSPGKPGSIEKGETDQRGYEIVIQTASPVRKLDVTVTLRVQREGSL
ncbi:MAG: heparinase II/III family protein [Acidobacteria bacterium]|nr:heparinase II/III family protein [Acidobacteriota bacterium]